MFASCNVGICCYVYFPSSWKAVTYKPKRWSWAVSGAGAVTVAMNGSCGGFVSLGISPLCAAVITRANEQVHVLLCHVGSGPVGPWGCSEHTCALGNACASGNCGLKSVPRASRSIEF